MPLYTYVVSYKGATHATQGSHSNFKGFIDAWCTNLPTGALPTLTLTLHRELAKKAYSADFHPVANLRHVWKKSIELTEGEFIIIAVQTQP
jgi:hypothetical protein